MDFANILTEEFVFSFLLLFVRFGAILSFMPIYSHGTIPIKHKAIFAFFLTTMFYSSVPSNAIPTTLFPIVGAIVNEIILGLVASLFLNICMYALIYAGEKIAFMMSFSLANVVDPQSNIQIPIISNILSLIALMVLLANDVHHSIILFVERSISKVPLGGFIMGENIYSYIIDAVTNFYIVGFSIAFPIIALSLLVDVIFGMLMKTMPQFNLLVVGFPVKIAVSLFVLVAILASTYVVFKIKFFKGFEDLRILLQ